MKGILGWEKSKEAGRDEAGDPSTYRSQAPLSPAVGSSSLPGNPTDSAWDLLQVGAVEKPGVHGHSGRREFP